jgi:hypothetical protein
MTPPKPEQPFAFISYHSRNPQAKVFVAKQLDAIGIKSWSYDIDSTTGMISENYDGALSDPLCCVVIALISVEALERYDVLTELRAAKEEARMRKIDLTDFLFLVSVHGEDEEMVKTLTQKLREKVQGAHRLIINPIYTINSTVIPKLQSIPCFSINNADPSGDPLMTLNHHDSHLSAKQVLAGQYNLALNILNDPNYESIRAMATKADGSHVPHGTIRPDFANALVEDAILAEGVKWSATFYLDQTRTQESKENLRAFLADFNSIKRPPELQGDVIETRHLDVIPKEAIFPLGGDTLTARDLSTFLFDKKQSIAIITNPDGTVFGIVTHHDMLDHRPAPDAKIDTNLACINQKPKMAMLGEPMQPACEIVVNGRMKKLLILGKDNHPAGLLTSETAEAWIYNNS